MRRRATMCALFGGLLAAALLRPVPAGADSATILVGNGYVSPKVLLVDRDVTLSFEWLEGTHRLLAYRNASWDSGQRASPSVYQTHFGGGTVKYLCTIHARLDVTGHCSGMCGIVTDDPNLDTHPPNARIDDPRPDEVVVVVPEVDTARTTVRLPVVIEGVAWDDRNVVGVGVRLWDNSGRTLDQAAECAACPQSATVSWQAEFSLLPGTYLVEVAAVDGAENRVLTERQRFVVV